MSEQTLIIINTWAIYLGLFVTTCLTISSMLFLIYYISKSVFFWRYKVISEKIKVILLQVIERNKVPGGNRELCFLAGSLLMILSPKHFNRQSLDELKEDLQLDGVTEFEIEE